MVALGCNIETLMVSDNQYKDHVNLIFPAKFICPSCQQRAHDTNFPVNIEIRNFSVAVTLC